MKLTSSAFEHNAKIPEKYTCDGENISPPLLVGDVPPDAQSLVLVMDDPDVPISVSKSGIWDHWVIFNMPIETNMINEGEVPQGVIGLNTGGEAKYIGPCPPDKEHRYFFKLFALDTKLTLGPRATKEDVLGAMKGHVIAQAEFIGLYERKRQ